MTVGDITKTTRAKIEDLVTGTYPVTIRLDGYADYTTTVTVTADTPVNLNTIPLIQKAGDLVLSSPQGDVSYTITGASGYSHDGSVPDKVQGLPIGDYTIVATQKDWKLPPISIVISDKAHHREGDQVSLRESDDHQLALRGHCARRPRRPRHDAGHPPVGSAEKTCILRSISRPTRFSTWMSMSATSATSSSR